MGFPQVLDWDNEFAPLLLILMDTIRGVASFAAVLKPLPQAGLQNSFPVVTQTYCANDAMSPPEVSFCFQSLATPYILILVL